MLNFGSKVQLGNHLLECAHSLGEVFGQSRERRKGFPLFAYSAGASWWLLRPTHFSEYGTHTFGDVGVGIGPRRSTKTRHRLSNFGAFKETLSPTQHIRDTTLSKCLFEIL
jgi:hypothetical protein